MNFGKFVKNKKYYSGIVYEWNLPTGTTCPFALECKVVVDRISGKFDVTKGAYRCYAASAERFPAVRNHRWNNFELVKNGGKPTIPKDCKAIRIHASGDFFNQSYFDLWIQLAKENPCVEMWAYTKSLGYWVNRISEIPKNLILTFSPSSSNLAVSPSDVFKYLTLILSLDAKTNDVKIIITHIDKNIIFFFI